MKTNKVWWHFPDGQHNLSGWGCWEDEWYGGDGQAEREREKFLQQTHLWNREKKAVTIGQLKRVLLISLPTHIPFFTFCYVIGVKNQSVAAASAPTFLENSRLSLWWGTAFFSYVMLRKLDNDNEKSSIETSRERESCSEATSFITTLLSFPESSTGGQSLCIQHE